MNNSSCTLTKHWSLDGRKLKLESNCVLSNLPMVTLPLSRQINHSAHIGTLRAIGLKARIFYKLLQDVASWGVEVFLYRHEIVVMINVSIFRPFAEKYILEAFQKAYGFSEITSAD